MTALKAVVKVVSLLLMCPSLMLVGSVTELEVVLQPNSDTTVLYHR